MKISANPNEISMAVDYIRETLRKKRIRRKEIILATMSAEDVISSMITHAGKTEEEIHVNVISFLGGTEIRITCRGSALDLSEIKETQSFITEDMDEDAREVMNSLCERLTRDRLSLRSRQGVNYATVTVSRSKYRQLILTLCALAAGLLAGLLMKGMLPDDVQSFFKDPAMLTAYTFASSNAALPSSMRQCETGLGISRKLYAISLPIGATINMDGSCVVLCISALFMAKVFGIPVTPHLLVTLGLSVFVLSIGAPGVPGAALICMSILFPQIGVPAEAVSLVMGLYALVGMILTCTNVTGDAAITLITARHEKLMDLDVYRS
ncbi:MAG: cation:dicarboxylase symporter family transporter [Clostridia bacterium]|nr:cation:dicarboxylase symporter family transporter [Clostridia bacterium]